MTRGRPTTYRPAHADTARKAFANGSTAAEVAAVLEIDSATFYRWRGRHEDFAVACTTGKLLADEHVVNALHQRACGFEYVAERLFMPAHATDPVVGRYTRRVLADPRAALQWLRIRRPDEWRIRDGSKDEGEDEGSLSEILEKALRRVAEGRDPHGED
ncbi:MAG: hypothetical protein ABI240_18450 [Sphingomonas sp.]